MVYAITWDEATPTDDSFGYDIDVFIQNTLKAVRERLAEEHRSPTGAAGLAYAMHEWNVVAKSTGSPYTALETDHVLLITTGASDYTINLPTAVGISGKPYKIKKVDSGVGKVIIDASGTETIDGALTLNLITQHDFADLVSDGANWVKVSSITGLTGIGLKGHFSNLRIEPATGELNSTYKVVITADSIILENVSGAYIEAKSVSLTLDLSTSGVANGLDTGSIANATWYFIWAISDGTTNASLASLSSTAPTMPSGYTYKKLLGAIRNIGMITHLHMDGAESGTTFTDQSGKTWTANGNAQTTQTDKKYGTASALFDGTGDFIDTPDHADFSLGGKDWTMECWVRRGAIATQQGIFGQGSTLATAPYGMYFEVTSNNLRARLNGGAVDIVVGSVAETTTWHHIAFVRKGGLVKAFLDGVGTAASAFAAAITEPTNKLAIGKVGEDTTNYLNGKVDEFYITVGLAKYWDNFTPPTGAFVNLTSILPSLQIDRDVQLSYPHKVGDDVGSTTTASLSLATLIPTIAKGVNGKFMTNGVAIWHFSPKTFPNSIAAENNFAIKAISPSAATLPFPWELPILEEAQTMYHQPSASTVDVWVSGYTLRGI